MDFSRERSKWWFGVCYHKQQLDNIIGCVDIRAYAYILHDKDILKETGEMKKPHYHFLVQLYDRQRGSWFKRFWSDDMGRIFPEPTQFPKSCFEYLTHKDDKSRKQCKFLYDDSEVVSTFGEIENEEVRAEDSSDNAFADLQFVVNGQMTWHEFYKKYPKRIHSSAQFRTVYNQLFEEAYGVIEPRKLPPPTDSIMRKKAEESPPPSKSQRKTNSDELKPLPDGDPLYDIF